MKLGIDASRANRDQKTGVEWYAYHIIQKFKKIIPPEVEVVLYSQEKLTGKLADLPPNWRSKVLNWPPQILWTHLRLSWEILLHPVDLLFIPAHVIPLIHGQKVATTLPDIAYKHFPGAYSGTESWYQNFAVNLAKKHAKKVFVPSSATKDDLQKFYQFPADKITAIPLGYDNQEYRIINDSEQINQILAKYQIKKPFLLSVGRLELKKNTIGIIQAFNYLNSQIPNIKYQLLLIGPEGHGYPKIEKEITASPYQNKIIRPGWVAQADLPYIFNAAECFLFPSFYEGFGIPIIEAMACGCPVITSNRSAMPEVANAAAVLVDPEKPEEIGRQILKLAKDPEFEDSLAKRGLEHVTYFSWQQTAQKTWEILSQILNK
ncbi:MAG: glycosyltransferase family 1 protein [Patescibacteria group bacterium]